MSETVWRRHCLVLLLAQLVITGIYISGEPAGFVLANIKCTVAVFVTWSAGTWGTSTKESLATSSSETSSPLMSPFYTSSKALSHYTSPYHTTSQSSNQTFSSPYHSTIITSSLTALSSLYSSPESNFTQTSAIVSGSQSPSSKPEPASEDQNFRLLLYIVPPLSFIVVIVISIFLVSVYLFLTVSSLSAPLVTQTQTHTHRYYV